MTKRTRTHQIISIVTLFLCLFLSFSMPVFAKTKVKLNKTRITLETEKKYTLQLTGTNKKVTWKVSGKKIVSIAPKGKNKQKAVVTAKKQTGICYVTAKVGKKQYRCRVVVKKKTNPKVTPTPTPTPTPISEPTKPVKEKDILAAANASVKLFQTMYAEESKTKNVLISPYSILEAVALIENGANGQTRSEIETALGNTTDDFSNFLAVTDKKLSNSNYIKYQTANSIWYNAPKISLKEDYMNRMRNIFSAKVQGLPFNDGAVNKINSWVAEKTNNKINGIIDQLDENDMCILVNAIYLNAKWAEQYSSTQKENFTDISGTQKKVNMLNGKEGIYMTVNGGEGFVKAYQDKLAFVGLLPPESQTIDQFVSTLTGQNFITAYKNRQRYVYDVYTKIPEFTVEYSNGNLVEILRKLGINTAFTGNADFSLMSDMQLFVDRGIHKTYMKLDKNGTEAAAATAFGMKNSAAPVSKPAKYIYLNKPFVYAIVDVETGVPIFMGVTKKI